MRRKRASQTLPLFDELARINARVLAEGKALKHEQWVGRRRNRKKNSNWTPGRQVLSEITKLISDRHDGPCDTDDGETYFTAALPWLVEKAGGFEVEGCEDRLLDWAAAVTPLLDGRTVAACITEARQRDMRRKLYWTPAELGDLLRLTVAEREQLHITKIRPGGMKPREFAAYQRARKTAAEKARRAAKGATPRQHSAAQTKPWDAYGMSQRSYYRHKKAGTLPALGTNACPADTKYLQTTSEQCHAAEHSVPGPARKASPRRSVGAGGPSPRGIPTGVQIIRPLPPPLPSGGSSDHPDFFGPWQRLDGVAEAVQDYMGGIMPSEVIRAVRAAQRARMQRQQDVARRIGVSPPQLSKALKQRFGLSRAAADNLREWLAAA